MLNKNILNLLKQLEVDIPDWYMIHPKLQTSIAEWILQDRTELHEEAA